MAREVMLCASLFYVEGSTINCAIFGGATPLCFRDLGGENNRTFIAVPITPLYLFTLSTDSVSSTCQKCASEDRLT